MLWYDQHCILTCFFQSTAVITWNHYKQVGCEWIQPQHKGSIDHFCDYLFSKDSKVSYMIIWVCLFFTVSPKLKTFSNLKKIAKKAILSKIFYLVGIILHVKPPSLTEFVSFYFFLILFLLLLFVSHCIALIIYIFLFPRDPVRTDTILVRFLAPETRLLPGPQHSRLLINIY